MEFDLEELAAIVEVLKDADFTVFRLQKGDLSLTVTRGAADLAALSDAGTPASAAHVASHSIADPTDRPSPNGSAPPSPPKPQPAQVSSLTASLDEAGETLVTTPMFGTFYRRPKPGEPPFVDSGDMVAPDSVVGIVEVMKLMTPVTAGQTGEVTRFFVTDGDLVELGQAICAVRVSA